MVWLGNVTLIGHISFEIPSEIFCLLSWLNLGTAYVVADRLSVNWLVHRGKHLFWTAIKEVKTLGPQKSHSCSAGSMRSKIDMGASPNNVNSCNMQKQPHSHSDNNE